MFRHLPSDLWIFSNLKAFTAGTLCHCARHVTCKLPNPEELNWFASERDVAVRWIIASRSPFFAGLGAILYLFYPMQIVPLLPQSFASLMDSWSITYIPIWILLCQITTHHVPDWTLEIYCSWTLVACFFRAVYLFEKRFRLQFRPFLALNYEPLFVFCSNPRKNMNSCRALSFPCQQIVRVFQNVATNIDISVVATTVLCDPVLFWQSTASHRMSGSELHQTDARIRHGAFTSALMCAISSESSATTWLGCSSISVHRSPRGDYPALVGQDTAVELFA